MKRFNKKKKLYIILFTLIMCIGIGYAFLNATLNINGTAKINNNTWDIHFINLQDNFNSVELSTGDSAAVINPSNNTEVTYTITLQKPGDFYEFTVDAKNFGTIDGMIESVSSKLGGVEISSTNPLPVYLDYSVTYDDDIPIDENHLLTAGSFVTYKVRLEYKKDIEISDLPGSLQTYSFSFGITSIQSDETAIIKPEWPVIGDHIMTENTYRSSTYRNKIKIINLYDEINPPSNPVESWDIGVAQNGNVMAYITTNADDNTLYDLTIQGDGALYANPDSSYLFYNLANVDSINNINVLDTSKVTNMSYMFTSTGHNSTVFTLDLGEKFDTSKVTNMSNMFWYTGYSSTVFTLDLGSKFDTTKVTDMGGMFRETGYSSLVFTLNLGEKFDTSNVNIIYNMFQSTGYNSLSFTLNLGDKFDTSNVTSSMVYMFSSTGYSSTVFTLDLGSKFDTSNVTDMSYMFFYTGNRSTVFTLDLGSKFNTSNVIYMYGMFSSVGYSSPVFTLDLGDKFDTSKVTNMSSMFNQTGYSSTVFTLDLGSKFDTSNVTNMSYMFSRTGYSSTVFTLDLGSKFDTSKVTNMSSMFQYTNYNNTAFELDISTFDFGLVSSFDSIFQGFRMSNKIYVKDAVARDWIINNSGNSNLTTANVLIKGA